MSFLAIGNDELKGRPGYAKGSRVVRQKDGKVFEVRFGTDPKTGKEDGLLAFIKDGENSFLVGVGGSLLSGWELEQVAKDV